MEIEDLSNHELNQIEKALKKAPKGHLDVVISKVTVRRMLQEIRDRREREEAQRYAALMQGTDKIGFA